MRLLILVSLALVACKKEPQGRSCGNSYDCARTEIQLLLGPEASQGVQCIKLNNRVMACQVGELNFTCEWFTDDATCLRGKWSP